MDSERRQTDNTSGDRNGGWNLKQYVVIALVVFITFCCCILFFFMIYRYNGFADFWKKLTTILQPIIMGLVLAYLLNPVMKFLERHLMKLLEPRMKSKTKAKKMSRGVAIAGAWVFLGGIVVLLIAAIVPSIIQSIQGIATGLPSEVKNIMDWSDEFFKGDSEIVGVINDVLQKASDAVQKFLENDLLAQVQVYLTSIASGVIYTLKFLLNLVVGIIVSIYVLASQETFAGQAKKIIYAMFKPVRANVIVETVRKSNEIFGGFISGKLLDSAIIGILAYYENAGYDPACSDHRRDQHYCVFRTVYRSNSVIPYRCIAESAAGSVLSHFHLYSPADRRQYYRTEDPRRFYWA